MATASVTVESKPKSQTLQELVERLGNVPLNRIRLDPPPGQATEKDVAEVRDKEKRLCELVEGTLVEKAMGYRESLLAMFIVEVLNAFVRPRNLGLVTGEAGMLRLFRGLVRIPDVSYASWDRVPGRTVPREPVPNLVPDLAIEVLSQSNTDAEMQRKRKEYLDAGVKLVWIVDPETRSVAVYTPAQPATVLRPPQSLEGGAVLPGFSLSLSELFAELDRQG